MKVQLLYFDGCPHWKETDKRLRAALHVVGHDDVDVERVLVSTPEDAERWGFPGSPTVLVDGQDHFADPGASVGLSCRLYRTSNGPAGAPTVERLTEVLRGCDARTQLATQAGSRDAPVRHVGDADSR